MALHVHTFMQNPNDSHAAGLGEIKDNMQPILATPQIWCKLFYIAAEVRLLGEHFESFVKADKIGSRLLEAELENRVFIDSVEIRSRFRREAIGGHRPSAGLRLRP